MSAKLAPEIEMARNNLITGIILSLLSLLAILYLIPGYIEVREGATASVSPRLFPYITAVCLLFLSVLMSISSALKLRRPDNLIEEESEENEVLGFGKKELLNCLYLALGVVGYMLLWKYTNFVIAGAVMMAVGMYVAGIRGFILPIVAIAFPWAMKLIFWYTLEVQLP